MRDKGGAMKPRVLPFSDYLDAVRRMHRVDSDEIAESAGVTPSEVRRWRRGTHSPSWEATEALTARWGGDGRLVYLGVVLERFARQVGCTLDEAAALLASRRRSTPSHKRGARNAQGDRRQLSFLPQRG
jgi:transcriptional regulator with XRE-family HTH domain